MARRDRFGAPTVWAVAVSAALALVTTACASVPTSSGGDVTSGTLRQGGQVTFAAEQEPTGWNNATATDSSQVTGTLVQGVYPSAFLQMPDFGLIRNADLLSSAEQVSTQPQVVEYRLHGEARWSDSTPISADDFMYAWQQQNGSIPDNDVASTVGYDRIDSVVGSVGGKVVTVTVTFAQPYGEWRGLFDQLLPAHIMNELPGGWNDGLDGANIPSFSGGPFRLVDYSPGQSVRLVRNEQWWATPARLEAIVVRFGIDASALPQAMANGEIDVAAPSPQIDLIRRFDELAPAIDNQTALGLSFEHLDFNLDNPHLARLPVRQAIARALDRDALVAATIAQFDDDSRRLDNRIWLTGQPQYVPHGQDFVGGDVDGARSLLEDAGYRLGDDGIYQIDGQSLSLRISTTGGDRLRESTELVIVDQLGDVGIEVVVANEPGLSVFERFFPVSGDPADRNFDLALFAWSGGPFPSSNASLYGVDSPQNLMGYARPELDALFDRALSETDEDTMVDLYNQADELLWEDLPTIPLYTKPSFLVYRSTIANVEINPTSRGALWNAQEWGLLSR